MCGGKVGAVEEILDVELRAEAGAEAVEERGIETRAYFYPPVHEQEMFKPYTDRELPRTEELSRRVITLPFYTSITQDEMDYVTDALAQYEARGAAASVRHAHRFVL